MKTTKTHYRKVFKSDHLGIADLEDFLEEKVILKFTIREVKQELNVSVAGKKGDFNIAYFNEPIKPLVLNATNSKVLKGMTNSVFVEDWKNLPVELFIDANVKMKGEIVGGVRIKAGIKVLPELTKESPAYQKAVDHIRGGGVIADIEKRFYLTDEMKKEVTNDAQ
jgi:hypothetical protein